MKKLNPDYNVWMGISIPVQDAVNFSGNYLYPHIIDKYQCYSCFYCNADNVELIQFGYEASTSEEWETCKRMVSQEDANAVEVCRRCLVNALSRLKINKDQSKITPEQKARDLLERMEVPNAQDYTAGELVELANLLVEK